MKKDDCIFCKLANGEIPTNALYEDDIVKVIFDANPAAKGHVLILPKEHFDNIYGLNIVQNNGEVAGQTVFHFHMHIIPRIKGDTVNVGWVPGTADNETIASIVERVTPYL